MRAGRELHGGGPLPPERVELEAAEEAYDQGAQVEPMLPGGARLVLNTPALKAWHADGFPRGTVLLGVRGTVTTDWRDLKADLSLVFNQLRTTQRYQADKAAVARLAAAFPPSANDWYFAGHSLGGAVALQLQRDFPFIHAGIGFNSALQPADVWSQPAGDTQLYIAGDPLYRTVGWLWRRKRVLPAASSMDKDGFADALRAHQLARFSGRV